MIFWRWHYFYFLFSKKTINCLDIHQRDCIKQLSLQLSLIFKRFYSYIQLQIFFNLIYQNVGKKFWILWKERNENDPLKSPTKICGSMFPFQFFWIFSFFRFFGCEIFPASRFWMNGSLGMSKIFLFILQLHNENRKERKKDRKSILI